MKLITDDGTELDVQVLADKRAIVSVDHRLRPDEVEQIRRAWRIHFGENAHVLVCEPGIGITATANRFRRAWRAFWL